MHPRDVMVLVAAGAVIVYVLWCMWKINSHLHNNLK